MKIKVFVGGTKMTQKYELTDNSILDHNFILGHVYYGTAKDNERLEENQIFHCLKVFGRKTLETKDGYVFYMDDSIFSEMKDITSDKQKQIEQKRRQKEVIK